jgi:hypothetical protein
MISSAELNGITFNAYDEDETFWGMDTLEGWGSPGTDASFVKKVGQHGSWSIVPQPTLTERTLSMGGVVRASTYELMAAAVHKLNAAVTLGLSELAVIDMSGQRLTVQVQRAGEVIIQMNGTSFAWSAIVTAPDPRKYGAAIVAFTGLPSSSGGLTWPHTWPVEWDGVSTSGVITIENPGDVPAPVYARIDGPVPSPVIRHVNSGKELVLASSYVLLDGSWLDIDMERRQVLEAGVASRNNYITQRGFFELDPGDNEIIFNAASYNPDALLTITATPAYL